MIEIDIQPIPSQRLNVVLDDQNCTIRLYHRAGRLFFDLWVNDTLISAGNICNYGASVISYPVRGFTGSFHFRDVDGVSDPEYSGLGTRWQLFYVSRGEDLPEEFMY